MRDKAARNGVPHAQTGDSLQQARSTESCDRIQNRFPPEDPAGHREAQRRIAQMNQFHGPTPSYNRVFVSYLRGSPKQDGWYKLTVATAPQSVNALPCHGYGTKVRGGNQGEWPGCRSQRPCAGSGKSLARARSFAPRMPGSGRRRQTLPAFHGTRMAWIFCAAASFWKAARSVFCSSAHWPRKPSACFFSLSNSW